MKLLGVDFGVKKIGLAVSEGELAEPLAVVKNNLRTLERIFAWCQQQEVEKIVLGLPEGRTGQLVRQFGEKLAETTRLPIVYQAEVLTTKEAIAKMIEAGKRKKYRREKEDAFAAALILQAYLDKLEKRG